MAQSKWWKPVGLGTCKEEGCYRDIHRKKSQLCRHHYDLAHGMKDEPSRLTRCDPMWDVDPVTGCWNWLGGKDKKGYGQYGHSRAGRIAYQRLHQIPLPVHIQVHHVCHNVACVNPYHLMPIASGEHQRLDNHLSKRTHCPQGHEYTPDNLVPNKLKSGRRVCRTCHNEKASAYRKRKRGESLGYQG